jgi:uncharacterized surface protein with fasciclin (FAS1) repeats
VGVTASKAQRARRALAGAVAGLATVTVAATVAACGSSNTVSATPTGGAAPYSGHPSASPHGTPRTTAQIGHDCGLIPAKGEGSINQIGTERAITAASRNPQLSVFIAAVRTAGLDKTLNSGRAFTLMVPVNSAFASLSRTQIVHLHNSGDLLKVVRYHALHARVSPQQFASGARPVTLLGKHLTLSKSGSVYKVNGATVLCGNIKTANATVYIVSKVLLPPG